MCENNENKGMNKGMDEYNNWVEKTMIENRKKKKTTISVTKTYYSLSCPLCGAQMQKNHPHNIKNIGDVMCKGCTRVFKIEFEKGIHGEDIDYGLFCLTHNIYDKKEEKDEIVPPHLCDTCVKEFAKCDAEDIKFLCDHPKLKPQIPKQNDLVYACSDYVEKKEEK